MANILISLEHGVELAAEDILKFLANAQTTTVKMEPGVLAALGVLLGATEAALIAAGKAAAMPLNIVLDADTLSDFKAIWPAVVSFAQALGIKV